MGRILRPLPVVLVLALALVGCASPAADSSELVAGLTPEEAQYIEQANQAVERTGQCLIDRGWNVEIAPDGWGVTDLDATQKSAYDADVADCQAETGMASMAPLPDSPERSHRLYEYEADLAECLRDEGFDVPETPSEQVFVDRYKTDNPWFAYATLDPGEVGPERWAEIEATCPPYGTVSG